MSENEKVTEELLRLYEERKKCRKPHYQCPNGCEPTKKLEQGCLPNRTVNTVWVDEITSEHYYVCTCSECKKQWLEPKADFREKQERIDQRIAELEMANKPKEKEPRKEKLKHWFKENFYLLFISLLGLTGVTAGIVAIISIL